MTTSPTNNNSCNNSNHQRPMDCIAKCTCNNSSSSGGGGGVGSSGIGPRYSSLKSLKLNNTPNGLISSGGGGFERKSTGPMVKKLSCDATTSPGRLLSRDIDMTDLNELRKKSEELIKLATGRAIASPRRVVATRNAATSPNLDMRKLGLTERKPKEIIAAAPNANATNSVVGQKITLEKSNSLGESKPIKQLRTTRSLSPRPPVRHQHAIMVSDENDIVSVKVSPNEDFEMEQGIATRMAEMTVREAIPATAAVSAVVAAVSPSSGGGAAGGGGGVKKKHKPSKSEQSSPNIADFDTKFSYNQTNNKSTGCLVYVPSDPWLKMSDLEEFKVNSLHKRHNLHKMSEGTRSLSRGKIEALPAADPWIWRKPIDGPRTVANAKKSPKKEVFRQAKSFSATKYELEGGDHTKSHRPKLQRCKSPLFLEDDILPPPPPPPTSAPSSPFLKAPENQFSPPPLFTAIPPPPAPPHYICSNSPVTSPARNKPCVIEQSHQQQTQRSFLDVVNPNLLQARHSFSSISQRDDELQLNIRRLSEQMRKTQAGSAAMITATTTATTGADFSDYLRQFRCSEAKKAAAAAQLQQQQQSQQQPPPPPLHHSSPKVTQTKLDSMLETTC